MRVMKPRFDNRLRYSYSGYEFDPVRVLVQQTGEMSLQSTCDSLGVILTAPNYTFTNVTAGYLIETQPNTIVDTFFKNGEFVVLPYVALALYIGIDTSMVCDQTTITDSLMHVTGKIYLGDTTISNGSYWIVFDEVDHCCRSLVTFTIEN